MLSSGNKTKSSNALAELKAMFDAGCCDGCCEGMVDGVGLGFVLLEEVEVEVRDISVEDLRWEGSHYSSH